MFPLTEATEIDASRIQVLVLGVSGLYLDALTYILESDAQVNINACVTDLTECVSQLEKLTPDVILVQEGALEAPVSSCFEELRRVQTELPILVYGREVDDDKLMDILNAGARGYFNENSPREELSRALKEIATGHLWVERRILESLAVKAIEMERILAESVRQKFQSLGSFLPKREMQVLQGIVSGASTKEIADQIFLSEQSVKLHLGRLFKKFDVSNRSQLILVIFDRISPVADIMKLF